MKKILIALACSFSWLGANALAGGLFGHHKGVYERAIGFMGQILDPDMQWGIKFMHLQNAWNLLAWKGKGPGTGVLIAHMDTGYSDHPELQNTNIRRDLQWNFIDGNRDMRHVFKFYQQPPHGHGTETLSTIASQPGCKGDFKYPKCVTGIAPAAEFMPLLVARTVILSEGQTLANAIHYAVQNGAQVISCSLGGVMPMPALEAAVDEAHRQGVIIVAAAGNYTGPIIAKPAAYQNVIAVAVATYGSGSPTPWKGSSNGPKIDWSAPAGGIASAFTFDNKEHGLNYDVMASYGTSNAAAISAGVAALWLSYHGREYLISRYGKENIVEVFRNIVKQYGVTTPPNWPVGTFGTGIIDAEKVLLAPLP